jgi:hypothetical protein
MLDRKDFPPLPSRNRAQKERKHEARAGLVKVTPKRECGVAASINHLPDELILEILGYLPCLDQDNFQLPSLISLSLTNRRLHALVVDKLYAAYDSFFCSPYPFLRTVISDRQLARKVRMMTFRYNAGGHGEFPPYQPSAPDKKTVKQGLKLLEVPGWKEWASDCNDPKGEREMIYAAILMCTPSISSLDIEDGGVPYKIPKWLELIRWTVNGSHTGHMHRFAHLRSVRVEVLNLKLRHLAPIFKIQSLRNLTLIGLMESSEAKIKESKADYLQRLVPAASSPIKELCLQEAFVDVTVLSVLLGFIRELRCLEYKHNDNRWLSGGRASELYWLSGSEIENLEMYPGVKLIYHNLTMALERHHKCLESLTLGEHLEHPPYYPQSNLIGSLHKFEGLTHLNVPLSALVNPFESVPQTFVENMPRSLRKLGVSVIWHTRKYTCISAVEHMATFCCEFMPLLEEMRIEAVDGNGTFYPYNWKTWLKPLSEQGVNLIVDEVLDISIVDEDNLLSGDRYGVDIPVDTFSGSESDEESLYSL